jgi:hypothetical protein
MPPQGYTFPGGLNFVGRVADEQLDPGLAPEVGRLGPVARAMGYLQNATADVADDTRNELLKRAYREIHTLRAGITAIQYTIDEVVANLGGEHPGGGQPVAGALKPVPRPRGETGRPTEGNINTAPIDTNELGGYQSARPPGWGNPPVEESDAELVRKGVDEGMSGGPPRPDTGVNQSFNQVNMPTQSSTPIMGAAGQYKQDANPPHVEPNESDLGVGPQLMQEGIDEGSGLTSDAMAAEAGAVAPSPEESQAAKQAEERAAGQSPQRRGRGGR